MHFLLFLSIAVFTDDFSDFLFRCLRSVERVLLVRVSTEERLQYTCQQQRKQNTGEQNEKKKQHTPKCVRTARDTEG